MYEFANIFPDIEVLLALEPEELGAKMLFLLQKRPPNYGLLPEWGLPVWIIDPVEADESREPAFHPQHLLVELWSPSGRQTRYPLNRRSEIELAETEALAWLEAQGLIVPAAGSNGQNGWRRLSRRARRFESEAEFANYAVARMLPREMLNPRIADKVWMAFMRGEFDVAAFQAMKAVEVAVRDAGGFGNNLIGVALMREAFAPDKGPLTDTVVERGEQVARMELFAGAIGSYKNPQSHRDVDLNDPAEAVEIILLANHLLRIVDACAKCKGGTP